jgi:hypothetical protein
LSGSAFTYIIPTMARLEITSLQPPEWAVDREVTTLQAAYKKLSVPLEVARNLSLEYHRNPNMSEYDGGTLPHDVLLTITNAAELCDFPIRGTRTPTSVIEGKLLFDRWLEMLQNTQHPRSRREKPYRSHNIAFEDTIAYTQHAMANPVQIKINLLLGLKNPADIAREGYLSQKPFVPSIDIRTDKKLLPIRTHYLDVLASALEEQIPYPFGLFQQN